MTLLARSSGTDDLFLLTDGEERMVSKSAFLKERGLDGLIKMQPYDFVALPMFGSYAHFNLEHANHEVGKRYGLVRIVRPGSYNVATGEECLPLLAENAMRVARCVTVEQGLSYKRLKPEHFIHTSPAIRSADTLKEAIRVRYGSSLKGISEEELLARGVSFTLLALERV